MADAARSARSLSGAGPTCANAPAGETLSRAPELEPRLERPRHQPPNRYP